MMFYVVGGTYKETTFTESMDGRSLERHGPFPDYDEALKAWRALTGRTIDDAHARYTIEKAA